MITVTYGETKTISWDLSGSGPIDLNDADSVTLYVTDENAQTTELDSTYDTDTIFHVLTGTLPVGRYVVSIYIVQDGALTIVPTTGVESLVVRAIFSPLVDQVRVLIPDTDGALFSDDEILTYLALAGDDPYEAAALALDALITKMTFDGYTSTVKTDDLSIQNNISALVARAAQLRTLSLDNSFVIIDPVCCPRHVEAVPWW